MFSVVQDKGVVSLYQAQIYHVNYSTWTHDYIGTIHYLLSMMTVYTVYADPVTLKTQFQFRHTHNWQWGGAGL